MSVPEDHHFLPKFYLSRWIDPGIGELWEYSRPHDKVVVRRRSPKGTGKQKHLYSIIGEVEPELREQVEIRLMSPLDDRAARALDEMINTRARPQTKELRDGWARFVMSLLHRSPRRIAYLENLIRTYEIETTPEEEEAYEKLRAPNDPATLKRLFADGDASRISRSRAVLLRSLVDSETIGNVIVGMRWGAIQVNEPKHRLLTCDDPVLMSNGLNHDRSFIALPIAPDLMFIAANHSDVLQSFSDQKSAVFEASMNDAICLQADRLVLGQTNRCLRFVENRLQRGAPPNNGGLEGRYTWSAPIA
ncbi:MAG: DUF4238 domain-containing protein [Caulobacteraceae bacterium]|nr:DUF4238 domain-containing protein [Caulobacteraceae bacterium]